MVMTPVVRINGQVADLSNLDIAWTKKNGELTPSETVSNNILTLSANVLNADKRSETYICTLKYDVNEEDPNSYKEVRAQIELTLVLDGQKGEDGQDGRAVRLNVTADRFYSTDGTNYTPDTITITANFQNCSLDIWQYSVNGTTWANITNGQHGFTLNGNTVTLAKTSDLFTDTCLAVHIKVLSNIANIIDTVTISRYTDYKSTIEEIDDQLDGVENIITNNQSLIEQKLDEIRLSVTETQQAQVTVNDQITQLRKDMSTEISQTAEGINITIQELYSQVNDLGETSEMMKTYFKATADGLMIAQDGNPVSTLMGYDHFAVLVNGEEVVQIYQDSLSVANGIFNTSLRIGHIKFNSYSDGVALEWAGD